MKKRTDGQFVVQGFYCSIAANYQVEIAAIFLCVFGNFSRYFKVFIYITMNILFK